MSCTVCALRAIVLVTFYTFFSSIATESEGCGLVRSLRHKAMRRYGQVSLCIVYPSLQKMQSLHAPGDSLLHELSATKTAQTVVWHLRPNSLNIAQERRSGWSSQCL